MKFDERLAAQVLSRTPNVIFSGSVVSAETGLKVGAVVFGRSAEESLAGGSKYGLDVVTEHGHNGQFPQPHLHAFEDVVDAQFMPGPNDCFLIRPPQPVLLPFNATHLHFVGGEMDVLHLSQREG